MQYALLEDRGLQPNDDLPSMALLYMYSKYRKDREELARAKAASRPKKRFS